MCVTLVNMNTSLTPMLSSNTSTQNPGLLKAMSDFRTRAGKIHSEPRTPCARSGKAFKGRKEPT